MAVDAHRFSKKRVVWSAVALVALFGLWYAFRPEKLFNNKRVDEALPATLSRLTPLFTGSFQGDARETTGRATVYQQPNGSRVLTLSNFATSNGQVLEVILLDGNSAFNAQAFTPGNTGDRDLGELKENQSEQSYLLPKGVDINRFNTVAIYSAGLHAVLGTANLEAF
jgi:hypothetical protein